MFMVNVLHLGLSYACNMSCKHCFVHKFKDSLQLDDYLRVIDELCFRGLFVILYTYGEPLLCPFFADVAKYGKEKGLVQILMTNGSLIDDEWVREFKVLGITTVNISLDSVDPNHHDDSRGFLGSYHLAINAINKCLSGKIDVGIAHTITQDNVLDLFRMYDMAVHLNVKNVSFLRARKNGRLISFSPQEMETYKSFFLYCVKNQGSLHTKFHDPTLLHLLNEQYHNGVLSKDDYEKHYYMNICHRNQTLSISPDGTVSRCNLFSIPIGKISHGQGISDILTQNKKCNENTVCYPPIS